MSLELVLGWMIVTLLGIGSIVAAEPFWGRRRSDEAQPIHRGCEAGGPGTGAEERRRAAR